MRRRDVALAVLVGLAVWAVWSYRTDGLIAILLVEPAGGVTALESVRQYVLSWGALAPLAYVIAVTVEVVVAPIPGTILYAPGGAIFGGFIGGTLSLLGNVIGATIACWLGATFGADWVATRAESGKLAAIHDRLASRGGWLVFVLRVNPFTSSDLVSYAPAWPACKSDTSRSAPWPAWPRRAPYRRIWRRACSSSCRDPHWSCSSLLW